MSQWVVHRVIEVAFVYMRANHVKLAGIASPVKKQPTQHEQT